MANATLFTRKYKNPGTTSDWWILDSEYSSTNPICIYTDIDNKHDATYVLNMYAKEQRAEKKRAKEEIVTEDENPIETFFGK